MFTFTLIWSTIQLVTMSRNGIDGHYLYLFLVVSSIIFTLGVVAFLIYKSLISSWDTGQPTSRLINQKKLSIHPENYLATFDSISNLSKDIEITTQNISGDSECIICLQKL